MMRVYLTPEVASVPLGNRIQLNKGVECVPASGGDDAQYRNGIFVPKGPWRNLNSTELAELSGGPDDPGSSIEIFKVPRYLYRACWDMGVGAAFAAGRSDQDADPLFREFRRESSRILRTVYPFITSCNLQLRACNLRSTTYDHDAGTFIGLHVDNFQKQPLDERIGSRARLVVNLGIETRSLIFINLEMMEILDRCGLPRTRKVFEEYRWAYPLAHMFMRKYPDYPVTRLLLRPGEGYRAPSQNLIHDGYTIGMTAPDLVLHGTP